LLKQIISLAYPMSDVIMVSLVIILIERGGRPIRVHLALVMAGVVAFAVADSSFTYLTEVNNYNGGNYLDTGWVAGYLLIGLGALWAMTSPSHQAEHVEASTISLVAPYLPVLVVLAVTAIQLLRGRHMETVSWIMAFALVLLVLGRELLRLLDQALTAPKDPHDIESVDDPTRSRDPDVETALLGRR
jgi:4-amino-4-deoxy-L-arabinose transferase-like glycosyltransferase